MLTLTYLGAQRITPNYNVMGVAKAALEASVRYLAVDLGGENIRVNAISAGPVKTLAGAAIGGARHVFRHSETHAPSAATPIWMRLAAPGCISPLIYRPALPVRCISSMAAITISVSPG